MESFRSILRTGVSKKNEKKKGDTRFSSAQRQSATFILKVFGHDLFETPLLYILYYIKGCSQHLINCFILLSGKFRSVKKIHV